MTFEINIDTDEDELVMRHLTDIRKTIKTYLAKVDAMSEGELDEEPSRDFSHNNCDGFWSLTIDING